MALAADSPVQGRVEPGAGHGVFRKHHLSAKDPRREEVLSRFAGNMSEALEVLWFREFPCWLGRCWSMKGIFPPGISIVIRGNPAERSSLRFALVAGVRGR